MIKDKVTLVDEQDRVLGEMDKIEAHRGVGRLHRAASVLFFRENKSGELELLVQQRSQQKIVGAEQWANTACGNVWPGESYEQCARRRLAFELVITEPMPLTDAYTFRYQVQCNDEFSENEIDHIFAGWFDGEVQPNPDEVSEYEWMNWEEVVRQGSMGLGADLDKDWAPWVKLMMKDEQLVESVEAELNRLKA